MEFLRSKPSGVLLEAFVDPRIDREQPGGSSEGGPGEEGVNYLRRLKGEVRAGTADTDPGEAVKAVAVKGATDWKERRQSPRLRCSGSVEFRTAGSDVRIWGTLTDISLHGCYVEMNSAFPIDTKVDLVLKSCGIRIAVLGTVRASYAFLGMGIGFAEIGAEEKLELKRLLAALGGQSAVFRGLPAHEHALSDGLRPADRRALCDEVTEFFRKNAVLSRDEFHQMAKRVRGA